jgi:hypothetical protein
MGPAAAARCPLAAMLYEMVTGMQPYHAESTEQWRRA